MKKRIALIFPILLVFMIIGESALSQKTPVSDDSSMPVMHPDGATLKRWFEQYRAEPRAYIHPGIARELETARKLGTGSSTNLLSHLDYVPADRNQGECGNCWVWAGTGVLEIALHVQNGIFQRLSEQVFDSCYTDQFACCGGTQTEFMNFYGDYGSAIPWTIYSPNFTTIFQDSDRKESCCQDGSSPCSAAVPCYDIDPTTGYAIMIDSEMISTDGEGQATAIANVKNVLRQNRGVVFTFWLGNWDPFRDWWKNNDETAVWDPDPSCGADWVDGKSGGHSVLIVGYDDTASPPYWLVLNSWGAPSDTATTEMPGSSRRTVFTMP
jgi:hypothetical protein